jgi:branched-subunit amino acid transport protein AzlD
MKTSTILLMILIPALITFLLRLTPFVLFGGKKEISPFVKRIGEKLPYSIMAALIIYCLKGVRTGVNPENTVTIVSVIVVAVVHLWRKNTILSIFVGTVCYMVLLRVFCV